jgi:copper chaperone CopZ
MRQEFEVTGMTCGACVQRVHDQLAQVPGVTQAEVSLNPPHVTLEAAAPVSGAMLNEALKSTRYRVSASGPEVPSSEASLSAMSAVRTPTEASPSARSAPSVVGVTAARSLRVYYPLALVFAFIAGTVSLVTVARDASWEFWMNGFMAGFFLVFSFFKLLDVPAFAGAFGGYDLIARRWPAYGYVYPFIELGLGLAYLVGLAPRATNAVALIVMVVGGIGVVQSVLDRRRIQCACLGTVFQLPMSQVTIFENSLMAVMAATMLIRGSGP